MTLLPPISYPHDLSKGGFDENSPVGVHKCPTLHLNMPRVRLRAQMPHRLSIGLDIEGITLLEAWGEKLEQALVDQANWHFPCRILLPLHDGRFTDRNCRNPGPMAAAALDANGVALKEAMWGRIAALAQAAAEAEVRLMIDAEQSWFQPAIDNIVYGLQVRYTTWHDMA